ncbi:hypothetical protein Pint_03124 [Pistacia integerrima]|uniref:Uncharacterized protein n=1 Tax=Pistacia integerrima TaxID=434235 RepID=A0ACC0ZJ33_9ROSI|nr:hypothetical protein Pint_03124 [Pistacia integerrima]
MEFGGFEGRGGNMFEEKIVENGFYGGEKEQSDSSFDKVNPAKLPSLTWKRKLNSDDITLSSFSMTWKEIIHLAPIGIRILQHIREEDAKGRRVFLNPFIKRLLTSSQGIPLGGIG